MISKEEFEKRISITLEGVAINNRTGKPVAWKNSAGYLKIQTPDGIEMIHRLVWMYHNSWGNIEGIVIHKDGNKLNNSITNLENTVVHKATSTKSYGNTRVELTSDMINEVANRYTYDPINGGLINNKTGMQNKSVASGGKYKVIMLLGRSTYVHRIVWMMHNNWEEPSGVIDHINGNSLDNRIENLRNVTHTENMANRSNASQYGKWVRKHGNGGKVEFIFKGVPQFYSFPKLEDAMEFRDKVSMDIEKEIYKLKRPAKSTLPIGIFKKKSKTQKLPYLVSIENKDEMSFATVEEAIKYLES